MNRKIHVILGASVFTIFCLLLFQVFWLNRVIEFKKAEYLNAINNILAGAVESGLEGYLVSNRTVLQQAPVLSVDPDGKVVKFFWKGDTTVVASMTEGGYLGTLRKVCYDLVKEQPDENVVMLDSVCKSVFKSKGIEEEFILELISTENGEILATTEKSDSKVKKLLVSNMVELGLKSHHGVVAYFDTPYKAFFNQMGFALVSSFALLIILLFCFTYQIKTMISQYQLSKIREEFMNSMVHELKLPLAAMENAFVYIKSLGVDDMKEEQRDWLNITHKRVNHLNNFVYKLLIVWKEGFKISWNKLNLRETIGSLVALFDPMLIGKNVTIKVNYQLDVDVIEADEIHFPNALSNLIENAIKYSRDPSKVEIVCKEAGDMLVISVKDNGIGIPEKFQEKIFERYFRVPRGRSGAHGFGIGLSYVKQIIEAHDGIIRVESKVGEGTTFTVKIPLVKH